MRGSASKHSRADTGGGAYKSPPGKRIARSDAGNRPSSRFPTSSLQRNGSFEAFIYMRGPLWGAHRYVSAVSAEIVDGTLPRKRFSRRSLRRSVPVRHARVRGETARAAAGRTGGPAG
jgi:hypothetical protein